MAKKPEPKKKAPASSGRTTAFSLPPIHGNGWLFLRNFWFQAIVIVAVGVLYYGNTYRNLYALDDDIIMKQNMYVQKGFAGIGDILTNDAYKSYYESMGVNQQLAGGRYRPLSIVTFAIEQGIFGECYGARYTEVRDSLFELRGKGINDATTNRLIYEQNELDKKIKYENFRIAPIRHAMQVFWFVLSMVVLLWLFREHFFRSNTDIAFLSILLFTIHPIHTEVIANVKSRDEIFSLLFIGLTFIFFLRYDLWRRRKDMIYGVGSFLLALLSKEYAVVMVVLLPASAMIFHKRKLKDIFNPMIPFGIMLAVYFLIRLGAIGGAAAAPVDITKQDPLNDPYLYATPEQTIASKINRLDDYLYLLVIPWPLVSDYSYQHFPYSRFTDLTMWLSLLVNIGLVVLFFRLWKKRHPMSFALLIYLMFFALICNIFFDIGATMGERLIYHSSLGFCMAVAWLLVKGVGELGAKNANGVTEVDIRGMKNSEASNFSTEKNGMLQPVILTVVFIAIAIPCFIITTERNLQWKDDFTLFTHDVKVHPNSALTNGNAGARYMDLGLAWVGRDTIINGVQQKAGRDTVKIHRYADTALPYLIKATTLHKKYVNGYLNLGLCYYYTERYEEAAQAWGMAHYYFKSNPTLINYEQMLVGQANLRASKKDYAGAAKFFGYATVAFPTDEKAWTDYAGASYMAKDFKNSRIAFQTAIQLKPDLKTQLDNGLKAATFNEQMYQVWQADSMNVNNNINLAKSFLGTSEFYPVSRRLLNKALALDPNAEGVPRLLDSLNGLEQKLKTPPPVK